MQDFNNLPKSWQVKTLGECLDYEQPTKYIVKSTKYDDSYKTPVLTAGKSFILGYTNESDGIFTQTPVIIFDDFTTDTKFVDFDFKVKSSAMKILHPKENIDIKFIYYLMQTIQYRSDTHKRYWISQYAKIKIPIPPLEIQRRIVKRLDEAFSRIENGTKHLKSAKDNLTKYKQSLLKSAFEGTLTQDCPLSQSESIAESSLRGSGKATTKQSIKSKMDCHESANADSRSDDKDSLNDKSSNLPQGWTIKTLGEVCEINPKNKLDDNLEVSFIPMNLILDKFQNKFSYETKIWKNIKKGYTHLQNNCIALAKITPCFENGKCVILDNLKNGYGAGTTEIIVLLPNAQKAFVKYIFYFLNTQSFIEKGKRNFKGTAGQLRISTDFVSNCKIPIPPLEIQRQIVAILDGHFTSADKVSAYIDSCLSKAKQLKSSLLKSAFAGELV